MKNNYHKTPENFMKPKILPTHSALRASQHANPLFFSATFFEWVDYTCYHILLPFPLLSSSKVASALTALKNIPQLQKTPELEGSFRFHSQLVSIKQQEDFNSFKDYLFHLQKSVSSLFWFKAHNTYPPITSQSAQKSLILPHDSPLIILEHCKIGEKCLWKALSWFSNHLNLFLYSSTYTFTS